jgi:hypothetical protein
MKSFKDFVVEAKAKTPPPKTGLAKRSLNYIKQNHGVSIAKHNEKNFGIIGKFLNKMLGLGKKPAKPRVKRKKKP